MAIEYVDPFTLKGGELLVFADSNEIDIMRFVKITMDGDGKESWYSVHYIQEVNNCEYDIGEEDCLMFAELESLTSTFRLLTEYEKAQYL